MLIRIFKMTIIGFILSSTLTFAQEGIYFNAAKGNKEAVFNTMVHEKIEGIGFKLSSFHERINDVYKKKYGTKGKTGYDSDYEERLDSLGFFSISNDKELRSLLLKEPRLGAFSPFNLYMYKYIDKDITRVGHLNPELMLDIVDVKDKGVRNVNLSFNVRIIFMILLMLFKSSLKRLWMRTGILLRDLKTFQRFMQIEKKSSLSMILILSTPCVH